MAYLNCSNCRHHRYCPLQMTGDEAEGCEHYNDDLTGAVEKPCEFDEVE